MLSLACRALRPARRGGDRWPAEGSSSRTGLDLPRRTRAGWSKVKERSWNEREAEVRLALNGGRSEEYARSVRRLGRRRLALSPARRDAPYSCPPGRQGADTTARYRQGAAPSLKAADSSSNVARGVLRPTLDSGRTLAESPRHAFPRPLDGVTCRPSRLNQTGPPPQARESRRSALDVQLVPIDGESMGCNAQPRRDNAPRCVDRLAAARGVDP